MTTKPELIEGAKACVFDTYGTLLDYSAAAARHKDVLGPRCENIGDSWRRKQLEYTWLRSMMKQYAPFSQVTEEALRFSLKCCQYTRDNESPVHVVCELLLKEYNMLPPYPEVKNALSQLKARGYKLAVLSNGTPQMLKEGVASAGLQEGLFDELISVDEVQLYKPDPQVYALAMRKLGLDSPQEVCYVSGNGWDVAGAANFGFQTGSS